MSFTECCRMTHGAPAWTGHDCRVATILLSPRASSFSYRFLADTVVRRSLNKRNRCRSIARRHRLESLFVRPFVWYSRGYDDRCFDATWRLCENDFVSKKPCSRHVRRCETNNNTSVHLTSLPCDTVFTETLKCNRRPAHASKCLYDACWFTLLIINRKRVRSTGVGTGRVPQTVVPSSWIASL